MCECVCVRERETDRDTEKERVRASSHLPLAHESTGKGEGERQGGDPAVAAAAASRNLQGTAVAVREHALRDASRARAHILALRFAHAKGAFVLVRIPMRLRVGSMVWMGG